MWIQGNPASLLPEAAQESDREVLEILAAKVIDLEQELAAAAQTKQPHPGIEGTVRAVYGRLTEAPTNWHQATIYFFATDAEEDSTMRARAPFMAIFGALMVFGQAATAMAIITGSITKSCTANNQCDNGFWCSDVEGQCQYCGEDVPLPLNGVVEVHKTSQNLQSLL